MFFQCFRFHHHAGTEQIHVFGRNVNQVDAHRDALLYLDEVAGRVIGRDEGVFGAGRFGDRRHGAVENAVVYSIYFDAYFLADVDMADFCFPYNWRLSICRCCGRGS